MKHLKCVRIIGKMSMLSNNVRINKRKLDNSFNRKRNNNTLYISKQPNFMHELLKCAVGIVLKKYDCTFQAECTFENGSKPDIFDLERDMVFEIMNTEKDSSIELKKEKYPVQEIITLKCADYENMTLKELEHHLDEVLLLRKERFKSLRYK